MKKISLLSSCQEHTKFSAESSLVLLILYFIVQLFFWIGESSTLFIFDSPPHRFIYIVLSMVLILLNWHFQTNQFISLIYKFIGLATWVWLPILFFKVQDFYEGNSIFPWYFDTQWKLDTWTRFHPLIVHTMSLYFFFSFMMFKEKIQSFFMFLIIYGPFLILSILWIVAKFFLIKPIYHG